MALAFAAFPLIQRMALQDDANRNGSILQKAFGDSFFTACIAALQFLLTGYYVSINLKLSQVAMVGFARRWHVLYELGEMIRLSTPVDSRSEVPLVDCTSVEGFQTWLACRRIMQVRCLTCRS
jgi:hypothetical protein